MRTPWLRVVAKRKACRQGAFKAEPTTWRFASTFHSPSLLTSFQLLPVARKLILAVPMQSDFICLRAGFPLKNAREPTGRAIQRRSGRLPAKRPPVAIDMRQG